ncbi:hypothetical protein LTR62_007526 [Meristemomyces frigidus]|uniref:Uncharacterized protein n=1 Tax=Meristemomyces frigidus TaxID=1508187 RepID=A0AAN7YHU1_9PEZI|nr:hypothetical protein LTR62_007526 [Meristemomyces frigidus]
MNAVDFGEGSLKSFYGYRETFNSGLQWVDIPQTLTFVHTNNPYDDAEGEPTEGAAPRDHYKAARDVHVEHDDAATDADFAQRLAALAHDVTDTRGRAWDTSQAARYSGYATQGLEALSAVASDRYTYAPPPDTMSDGQSRTGIDTQQATPAQAPLQNTLDDILHRESGDVAQPEAHIDPSLGLEIPTSIEPGPRAPQTPSHDQINDFHQGHV